MTRPEKTIIFVSVIGAVMLATVTARMLDYAKPFVEDAGLLYLSGVTAISRGEPIPFTQRGPLYSVFLWIISGPQDAETAAKAVAREYGSTRKLEVYDGLLATRFLRKVLWTQIILYGLTILLVGAILRAAGVRWRWTAFAVAACLLSPSGSQLDEVHDHLLNLFLITSGLWGFTLYLTRNLFLPLVLGSIALALSGLSRPTFQLLPLVLTLVFGLVVWRSGGRGATARFLVLSLAPWVILDVGWSLRNLVRNGFFGTSSGLGISLGAKASAFVERATPYFPDEGPVFLTIRNETLVRSRDHVGNTWSDEACQWLMTERSMSYLEADAFLAKVALKAISKAPLSYLYDVAVSAIRFLWPLAPGGGVVVRTLIAVFELTLAGLFVGMSVLWLSFLLLPKIRQQTRAVLLCKLDLVIVLALVIFFYTMTISSVADRAESLHRMSVQFLMPAAIAMIAERLTRTDE